jgi:hypothetical protein
VARRAVDAAVNFRPEVYPRALLADESLETPPFGHDEIPGTRQKICDILFPARLCFQFDVECEKVSSESSFFGYVVKYPRDETLFLAQSAE